jgi:hypothetical protein
VHNSHTPSRSSACAGTVPASTAAPDLCRRPIPICADVLTNTAGPTLPVWADRGRLLLAPPVHRLSVAHPAGTWCSTECHNDGLTTQKNMARRHGCVLHEQKWNSQLASMELAVGVDVVEARHCWDEGAKSAAPSQPWLLCPRGLGPDETTWCARKVWGKEVCAPHTPHSAAPEIFFLPKEKVMVVSHHVERGSWRCHA